MCPSVISFVDFVISQWLFPPAISSSLFLSFSHSLFPSILSSLLPLLILLILPSSFSQPSSSSTRPSREIAILDPNVTQQSVRQALHFLYGRFPVLQTVREALCLLAAASFFDISLLCELCEEHISANLTPENLQECCNFFHKFYYGKYGEAILKASKAVLLRQAGKSAQIVAGLPFSIIEEVLSSDALCVSTEFDRYVLIKEVVARLDQEERQRVAAWIAGSIVEEVVEEALDDCVGAEGNQQQSGSGGNNHNPNNNNNKPRKVTGEPAAPAQTSSSRRATGASVVSAPLSLSAESEYSSGGEEYQDCEETNFHQAQMHSTTAASATSALDSRESVDLAASADSATEKSKRKQASSLSISSKRAESEAGSETPENTPSPCKSSSAKLEPGAGEDEYGDQLSTSELGSGDSSLDELKSKLLQSIHFSCFSVQELFKARAESFVPPEILTEALWRKEYVRTKIMQISLEPDTDPKLACEFFRLCRFFPKDACTVSGLNFCEPFAAFGSMWKVSAKVVKDNDKKFVACFLYRQRPDTSDDGQLHFSDAQPSRYYEFSISILTSTGVVRKSSCRKFANDGNADNCNWGWNKFLKFVSVEEVMNGSQLIISVKLRPVL